MKKITATTAGNAGKKLKLEKITIARLNLLALNPTVVVNSGICQSTMASCEFTQTPTQDM